MSRLFRPSAIDAALRAPYYPVLLACTVLVAFAGCGGERPAPYAGAPVPVSVFERVDRTHTARVGVKPDAPPFSERRGTVWRGFDIDIAEAVLARLGVETIVWVPVTTATRSDAVVDGTADLVIASMTQTRYRERRVDFTIPYFQDGQSLLVAKDAPIQTYQDLAHRAVGAEKGSTSSFYLRQVSPDARAVLYPDAEHLRQALENGSETAITSDLLLLIGLRRQMKDPAAWRIAGQRFTTEPYAMAVPQDQSAWRNALNHALLAIWEDGTWQRIADTWFGPGTPYEHRITFAMPVYPK